jgi:hypothetical protein
MVWLELASIQPWIRDRVLSGFLLKSRNQRSQCILLLLLLLRAGAPQFRVLIRLIRCSRGLISDLFQTVTYSRSILRVLRRVAPISQTFLRVLRRGAPITAGVSFRMIQSFQTVRRLIQIVCHRVGHIFFRVQMRYLWETGIQNPSPLSGPVALVVYPTFTLGPTAVRVQGVLPAFGWDM